MHVSYLLSHLEKLPVYDLYIVPGEWSQVQELRKIFSKGIFSFPVCVFPAAFANPATGKVPTLSKYDAYVIADTLLSWFSNMEDPLLTFELYEAWMSAAGTQCCFSFANWGEDIEHEHSREYCLRKVLHQLPKPNFLLFKRICRFLSNLVNNSASVSFIE